MGVHVSKFSIEKRVLAEGVHVGKLFSHKVIQWSLCPGHDRSVKFIKGGFDKRREGKFS